MRQTKPTPEVDPAESGFYSPHITRHRDVGRPSKGFPLTVLAAFIILALSPVGAYYLRKHVSPSTPAQMAPLVVSQVERVAPPQGVQAKEIAPDDVQISIPMATAEQVRREKSWQAMQDFHTACRGTGGKFVINVTYGAGDDDKATIEPTCELPEEAPHAP